MTEENHGGLRLSEYRKFRGIPARNLEDPLVVPTLPDEEEAVLIQLHPHHRHADARGHGHDSQRGDRQVSLAPATLTSLP